MEWKKISWRWFINNVKEPTHARFHKLRSVDVGAPEKLKTTNQSTAPAKASTKIPLNVMERLEAVATIIGGTSTILRAELDCASQELDSVIAELCT